MEECQEVVFGALEGYIFILILIKYQNSVTLITCLMLICLTVFNYFAGFQHPQTRNDIITGTGAPR